MSDKKSFVGAGEFICRTKKTHLFRRLSKSGLMIILQGIVIIK